MTVVAALPRNEAQRLRVLKKYEVLDTAPNASLDMLCQLVAATMGTPIALVSLLDEHRQWFKARYGLETTETSRDISFCGHAILGSEPFVVEDASVDPRFAVNPLVTGNPEIRFYAGVPLEVEPGVRLGTMCVIDRRARSFSDGEREQLRRMGELVVAELKRTVLEKRIEAQLERARRNARLARDHMQRSDLAGKLAALGWWELDVVGGVITWSPEVRRIHGVGPRFKPSLADALDFYAPDVRPLVAEYVRAAIDDAKPFKYELPFVTARGDHRFVRVVGEPTRRADGRVTVLGGAIQDITEERTATNKVEHMANHDGMTGLANRARFNVALVNAIEGLSRATPGLALILIDVDHFKAINDTLGHDAGDAAIIEVARRLKSVVRGEDLVARLGGDEFAVLTPGIAGRAGLDRVLHRLRGCTTEPWLWAGREHRLGLSLGAAIYEPALCGGDGLYKAADLALYEAKRGGRGRSCVFDGTAAALAA